MQTADSELKALDPNFDLRYLSYVLYYSRDMDEHLEGLRGMAMRVHIERARRANKARLDHLFDATIWPDLATQSLSKGLLNVPNFVSQVGEELGGRGCANACFRMVFAGITGIIPDSAHVARACKAKFGNIVIPSVNYLNFFHSNAFREFSGMKVHTYDILGTDYKTIGEVATKARIRWPQAKVHAVIPLATAQSDPNGLDNAIGVAHQGVLLHVNPEIVRYHDPKEREHFPHNARAFAKRWVQQLNQILMFVSYPDNSAQSQLA